MMMMLTLQKGLFADPRKQPQSTSLSQTKNVRLEAGGQRGVPNRSCQLNPHCDGLLE